MVAIIFLPNVYVRKIFRVHINLCCPLLSNKKERERDEESDCVHEETQKVCERVRHRWMRWREIERWPDRVRERVRDRDWERVIGRAWGTEKDRDR